MANHQLIKEILEGNTTSLSILPINNEVNLVFPLDVSSNRGLLTVRATWFFLSPLIWMFRVLRPVPPFMRCFRRFFVHDGGR